MLLSVKRFEKLIANASGPDATIFKKLQVVKMCQCRTENAVTLNKQENPEVLLCVGFIASDSRIDLDGNRIPTSEETVFDQNSYFMLFAPLSVNRNS
jgi:hypothetical protein